MEELRIHYQQLIKAYKRLKYMRNKFVKLTQGSNRKLCIAIGEDQEEIEDECITYRDALIKRFEICYDLTWKFFKRLLKEKYSIDANSPRKVFQECYKQKILTYDETEKLIEMIDASNETAHVYDESGADNISQKIVDYYDLLAAFVMRNGPV